MHLDGVLLASWLLLLWLFQAHALCPSDCTCRLDDRGRRKVSCTKGGMSNPIPVEHMDKGMEIVNITAPNGNWNTIVIGRVFQRFKLLEEIHITKSNVLQIGMHTFWGVPTLKVLNLSFNNISEIQDHNFRGLMNLLELNLNFNRIEYLDSGVFKHLLELRILSLDNNCIKEIVPRVFLKLTNLQVLRLSHNPIMELDPSIFKDILELRTFECQSCGLVRINAQIYHLLPYLSHLDIGYNRIQYLEPDEFQDLHRLRFLRLDGNLLPVIIERAFINQVELKTLHVARNRIVKITDNAFLNLSSLYELDISYNKMKQLEPVVLEPVSDTLTKIVLSGNRFPISVIRKIIHTLPKLREVALADMQLVDLQPGFFPDNIRSVDLSGNNLSTLNFTVLPRQLVELDLSRNKFKGFDEYVAVRLSRLHRLNLANNPWICDLCNMYAIIHHLNQSEAFLDIKCNEPGHLKDSLLNSLNLQSIPPCMKRDEENGLGIFNERVLIVCVGLFIFLIACIICVVIFCKERRARQMIRRSKGNAELDRTVMETPAAIFSSKGGISFEFPLDLTEMKVSVSTIDDMRRQVKFCNLPNGTGIQSLVALCEKGSITNNVVS